MTDTEARDLLRLFIAVYLVFLPLVGAFALLWSVRRKP